MIWRAWCVMAPKNMKKVLGFVRNVVIDLFRRLCGFHSRRKKQVIFINNKNTQLMGIALAYYGTEFAFLHPWQKFKSITGWIARHKACISSSSSSRLVKCWVICWGLRLSCKSFASFDLCRLLHASVEKSSAVLVVINICFDVGYIEGGHQDKISCHKRWEHRIHV